ncbi:hypothetical protein K432DRAFT_379113 [Lepidopterella palustris CBS 459.81]|uniref:RING-CH-type domain-containing protein n=1 Tax=Lepidopterella palustris CBS 459.81 TaxID=1314670 RepID=A0A8E2JIQ4_9PEZI|nr:hypothetical protein K432DRAFT_379113 [Lepidopterella palustris CBS 459.81]
MASLPPRPASQRRSSPREQESSSSADNHQAQLPRTDSEAFSTTSEDSQTLLLNRPQSPQSETTEQQQKQSSSSRPPAPASDNEPRKCWICFNDETEDEPMSSPEWRSPCPCVLVAHEKCLLDWIADMEAPSSRRRAGAPAKILCPQCKSEIHLTRPRSLIVDAVRSLERLTGFMLVPGIFVVLGSAAYTTATMLGTHAVYEIFGMEDGYQILQPLYQHPEIGEASPIVRFLNHLRHHWRLDLGLPLIPSVLIASRTTLTDSVLPVIPMIFFASSSSPDEMLNIGHWPPSAALTIALLPYLRGAYNAYYERVWLPKEQQWLKEIQPRAGEPQEGGNNGIENDDNGDGNRIHEIFEDDDGVVEVEVDFDIFADWNNGGAADNNNAAEPPPVPIARGPAPPLNAPPEDGQDAAPAPNVPQRRNRNRRERNLNFSTTSLADTVLGALLFPSIAAAVGEALRVMLPKSWVTPPSSGKATGLLQAKWGRSIVGGCLFVGVKDAVMLYVRWKMAQNHRKRRVLNYDKSKGKVVGP